MIAPVALLHIRKCHEDLRLPEAFPSKRTLSLAGRQFDSRTQARLLASTRHRVDRVHKGRLLLDGLVASSTAMPRDAAAATGWAISWLRASQTLAPTTGFTAPPSGLTAWLYKLPIRSPSTPPTAWREQVARWLAEVPDLRQLRPKCLTAKVVLGASQLEHRGVTTLVEKRINFISFDTWLAWSSNGLGTAQAAACVPASMHRCASMVMV